MDRRQRAAARRAAVEVGDVEAEARALAAESRGPSQVWVREVYAGTPRRWPWEDRLALAAYCGHPASRLVVGPPQTEPTWVEWDATVNLRAWLYALRSPRWPRAHLRAGVAAGEAALNGRRLSRYANEARAVRAGRAFVEDPTEETADAWRDATTAVLEQWAPRFVRASQYEQVMAACREIGESAVRRAIYDDLVSWALDRPAAP